MRRARNVAYGVIVLTLFLTSSCSILRRTEKSPAWLELRTALSAFAGGRELRQFDRAWQAGPDSQQAFLDRFWQGRDPTPGTERNEFRERFELRYAGAREVLRPPDADRADDRLIAYLRWGVPSGVDSTRYDRRSRLIGWAYRPDDPVALAGLSHKLLDDLIYVVTFERNEEQTHKLLATPGRRRWRPPPAPLRAGEIEELEEILSNEEGDRYLRAAATWRLRSDPGVEAFAVLLRHAHDGDSYVAGVIGQAISPLVAIRMSDGREVLAVEGLGSLARSPGEDLSLRQRPQRPDRPPDPGADPLRWSQFINRIYDPAGRLSPQAVAELRIAVAASDSTESARGWLTDEEAARIFVGPLLTARQMLDAGNSMGAHDLLDPLLLRSHRADPEAWHLDALALLESAEPGGRQLAEERVREALRLDPGNVRYQITLARILSRRTLDMYADRRLDLVLAQVPTAGDAYALKARMRLEVYWALGWKASGWATPVSERRMDPAVAVAEAIDLLDRALVVDPDNRLASWWLGTHYLMTEQWSEVIPVMSHLIREGVHLPEALLGRGLAFQHLGHLDMAWRDYLQGLAMLPGEVRWLAADARWVLPPSRGGESLAGRVGGGAAPTGEKPGIGGNPQEIGRPGGTEQRTTEEEVADDPFWRAKDPLFATDLNERLIEQVRRFAFVTWRFAVPNLGLRGWDTHRGRIYLRYGEPLLMATQSDALRQRLNPVAEESAAGSITDASEAAAAGVMAAVADAMLYDVKEIWRYEEMTFTFGGGMTSGNMVLWPTDFESDINSAADFDKLAERLPESSRVEGDREVRPIEATWYRFEGADGRSELIPVARFEPFEARGTGGSLVLGEQPVHLIVLDASWQALARTELALPRGFRVPPRGATWVGPLVRVPAEGTRGVTAVGPSATYAALEVVPSGQDPAYAARDTLDERGGTTLRLSSLVIATNIQEESRTALWRQGTFFTRQGQAIMPRPGGQFELNEPLIVYAEIYGLDRDEIGATDYQIALTITALDRRRGLAPIVSSALGRLTGRQEREGSVTLLFDRTDIRTRAHEQIRIVFPSGEFSDAYEVRFEVRDRVSGASASRITRVVRRGSSSDG